MNRPRYAVNRVSKLSDALTWWALPINPARALSSREHHNDGLIVGETETLTKHVGSRNGDSIRHLCQYFSPAFVRQNAIPRSMSTFSLSPFYYL